MAAVTGFATTVDAGDGLPLTVPALLRERAAARGDHPLLVCDECTLSYREAEQRSAALARDLLAAGAGHGTHVGLLFPNGPEFVVAWLAAARIGAVTVPLSTFSTVPELGTLLRGADVEILLSAEAFRHRNFVDDLQEVAPGLAGQLSGERPGPLLSSQVPALRRVAFPGGAQPFAARETPFRAGSPAGPEMLAAVEESVRPADRMVIVHTSGSTSAPKGVIHQHGPLIRHLNNLNRLRRYDESETLFSNSPFFWIGGFGYSLLGTLLAGATLACSNSPDPARVLDLLERTRPTMVNGFAQTVAQLAEDPSFPARDLSSIRRGNLWPILPPSIRPVDPELRHNMLGMTETGSVCLGGDDETDQPEHRRGSFGRPAPGLEAKLVDPETGQAAGAGKVAELWLRGPFLMEGYYGRERHETFEPDGWFRTGDLFRCDEEGFFYFTGRYGDMIKTAGANVSPREVEAAIADATGLLAHVVGLDDPARGQIVAAAVRLPAGRAEPDTGELLTALRGRLSAYKVPRRVLFLAEAQVPVLSSGKIDAAALKGLFGAR